MTIQEVKRLIAVITATFPSHYKHFTREMLEDHTKAWAVAFRDYSYEKASKGLSRYIDTDKSGFPPAPGQIIAKMPTIYEDQMNELIALQEQHRQKRLSGEVLHMREIPDTSTSYAPRIHEGEG